MAVNPIALWRMKEIVTLGDPNGEKQLENGNIVPEFTPKYKFHCAQYRISDRNIPSVNGTDLQDTLVLAVKHRPNFDYDIYDAMYRGKLYSITYIVPDATNLVTWDLLSLKSVHKNGGANIAFGGDGDGGD